MIALVLASVSSAGVLHVPSEYPTLQGALDAAFPGDVVEVAAGTHAGPFRVEAAITIRGAGAGETVLIAPSGEGATVQVDPAGGGHVVVEALTVRCGSDGVVRHTAGDLTLGDVEIGGCASSPSGEAAVLSRGAGVLTVERAVLQGGASGSSVLASESRALVLDDVLVSDARFYDAPIRIGGGRLDVRDLELSRLTASMPLILGAVDRADLVRVSLPCNATEGPLFTLEADQIRIDALMAWKNQVAVGEPAFWLSGDVRVRFATVLGQPGDTLIALDGPGAELRGVALGDGAVGVDLRHGPELDISHSVVGTERAGRGPVGVAELDGPGVTFASPDLWSVSPSPGCGGDLLAPRPGGNLVDAGPPGLLDGDGTIADVGATGGPDGFLLPLPDDADGDGHVGAALGGGDCDDLDPTVHPGAVEDLSHVDRDCDGHVDPAGPLRPRGCAHAPAGGAVGWALWVLIATRTRRVRTSRRL